MSRTITNHERKRRKGRKPVASRGGRHNSGAAPAHSWDMNFGQSTLSSYLADMSKNHKEAMNRKILWTEDQTMPLLKKFSISASA